MEPLHTRNQLYLKYVSSRSETDRLRFAEACTDWLAKQQGLPDIWIGKRSTACDQSRCSQFCNTIRPCSRRGWAPYDGTRLRLSLTQRPHHAFVKWDQFLMHWGIKWMLRLSPGEWRHLRTSAVFGLGCTNCGGSKEWQVEHSHLWWFQADCEPGVQTGQVSYPKGWRPFCYTSWGTGAAKSQFEPGLSAVAVRWGVEEVCDHEHPEGAVSIHEAPIWDLFRLASFRE